MRKKGRALSTPKGGLGVAMAFFLPAVLEFSVVCAGDAATASSKKTEAGRRMTSSVAQHGAGLNQDFAINAIGHMDFEN